MQFFGTHSIRVNENNTVNFQTPRANDYFIVPQCKVDVKKVLIQTAKSFDVLTHVSRGYDPWFASDRAHLL